MKSNNLSSIFKESEILEIIKSPKFEYELYFQIRVNKNKRRYFVVYFENGNIYYPTVVIGEVRKNFFQKYRGDRFEKAELFSTNKYYRTDFQF
jgi:hypothetical protein